MQVDPPCEIVGDTWPTDDPPPAAFWHDDSHQHLIALLARRPSSPPPTLSDIVEYRTLSLKTKDSIMHPGPLLRFRLPQSLAIDEYRSVVTGEVSMSRHIPLIAKLSLDQKLLAIQFSPTLLRIVPLEEDKHSKHWTIDFSTSGEPMPSPSHSVPLARYKVHESVTAKDSSVLPDGIVWSDHGGNSQDLVIVTTKSVLCYKISLARNQMAATHSFRHPQAHKVWWEPVTRTIVVGSYGQANECQNVHDKNIDVVALQLRTFLLRFPKKGKSKRLPRLELPPPRRLAPYAVGLPRTTRYTSVTATAIDLEDVSLVNLYGHAYIVELECNSNILEITFHRLDPSIGGIFYRRYTIDEAHPTKTDMETAFVSVIDNILCAILPESRRSLFIDIADTENSYFSDELDVRLRGLDAQTVSFVPPSTFFYRAGLGRAFLVALDIDRLSSTLPWTPTIAPFFLRRSSPKSHQIALAKFADTLRLPSARQRRQSVESVVQSYAMDRSALPWDWNASTILIQKCALLPPGSEFRHHQLDVGSTMQHKLSSTAPKSSVLYQKEILADILLPAAKAALVNSSASELCLVLEVAVGLLDALGRHYCRPCPALECFIIAILWRLGYPQELTAFLRSRVRPISSEDCSLQIPPSVFNAGTLVLANMLIAISEEVAFGEDGIPARTGQGKKSTHRRMRESLVSESVRLVSSRVRNLELVLKHLLSQGLFLEALSYCSSDLFSSEDYRIQKRSLDLNKQSRVGIEGEHFLRAALTITRTHDAVVEKCRLLHCLHTFVSRWDPDFIEPSWQRRPRVVGPNRSFDDGFMNRFQAAEGCRRHIARRPSSQSLLVMSKRQDYPSLGRHEMVCQSSLAAQFEGELTLLFGKDESNLLGHVRKLFGLAIK